MGTKQPEDVPSPAKQAADSPFSACIPSSRLDLLCSHLNDVQHLSPKVNGKPRWLQSAVPKRLQQTESRSCTNSHDRPYVTLTEEQAVLAVLRLPVAHIAYYLSPACS